MQLNFSVNHKPVSLEIMADEMLVDVLRGRLGLTGTKISCREGECGACTVWIDNLPVNSCLIPAAKAQGSNVTTIEGLGCIEQPHPVQERLAKYGASQCGYCTPGFVMSAAALLRDHPEASREEIIEGLSGNLCRCTGYTRIIASVESLADPTVNIPMPESEGRITTK
jgi:aerobic-type carbon monoxide dehydrogenase small subunit (CoxS/CutS family)